MTITTSNSNKVKPDSLDEMGRWDMRRPWSLH